LLSINIKFGDVYNQCRGTVCETKQRNNVVKESCVLEYGEGKNLRMEGTCDDINI
jgi:hypothetical protein